MIICTPEHGSVNMGHLFLTTIRTNPLYLIHTKLQNDLTQRRTKRVQLRGSYQKVARKFFPKLTGVTMKPIRVLILVTHGTRIWRTIPLIWPTPEAQQTICVIKRSRIAVKIKDTDTFKTQEDFPYKLEDALWSISGDKFMIFPNLIPETIRNNSCLCLVLWGYFLAQNRFHTQPHR